MHLRASAAAMLALTSITCGGREPPASDTTPEVTPSAVAAQAEAPMPFQLSPEQTAGKVVYETMCWSCHGSAGRGDGPAVLAGTVAPPRDFQSWSTAGMNVRQLQADFRAGAGSLDPSHPHMQNVLSLVSAEAFASALAYLPALTYPPEVPGSAIAGRTNFILRCQGCHGSAGKGDGAGAAVLEIRPADFTQDTLLAARDFNAVFQKIRNGGGGLHGSSMPAWGVMLKDGDVWDLVAFISSLRPGTLSPPPASIQ